MATAERGAPWTHHAVLGVLIAAGLRPDLRGGPRLDRQGVADHGAEVPAAARARPRGRHQRHPDAAVGRRVAARCTKDVARPGGRDHPQPGRQLRCRRVRGDHRRQQHRHLDPGQAGQEHPRHRAADRRAAVPPGPGRCGRRADPADHRRARAATGHRSPSTAVAERHRRRPSPTTSTNNGIVPRARCARPTQRDARRRPPSADARPRSPAATPAPDGRHARRCRSSSPSSTAPTRRRSARSCASPAPTTRRSRWSPASRTAPRSTSSARPRCSARTSSPRSAGLAHEQPGRRDRRLAGQPGLHRRAARRSSATRPGGWSARSRPAEPVRHRARRAGRLRARPEQRRRSSAAARRSPATSARPRPPTSPTC